MTAAVLGHLVLDEIHTVEGAVIESMGGMYFPLSAMAAIAGRHDTVRPVFPVGEDARPQFDAVFGAHQAVDARWCRTEARPNTRVRLHHASLAHYNTQLVCSMGPLSFDDITAAAADADLVYGNMMTGEDLRIDDARRLRALTRGLVYLDLHMIAYRVGARGERSTHPVDAWAAWAGVPHVLQCNEREITALAGDAGDDAERARRLFAAADLRMLVVTRGEEGAVLYPRDGAAVHIPAVPPLRPVDPTGCGDVFGATMAWHLASGFAPEAAARIAAHAASYVMSIPGSIGIEKLGDVVRRAAQQVERAA